MSLHDSLAISPISQSENQSTQSFNREEVIALCKVDLDFFACLVLPGVITYKFPKEFCAVWKLLTDNALTTKGFLRLAIGLPRGFAKTTLLKLFIVWCILLTERKFFLILGETASRAQHILADVADMLSEPNVIATFGNWKLHPATKDTQEEKSFSYRGKHITLIALGSGASLRGLNSHHARPDFILMDDMQGRENAKSPVLSNELLDWMLGTLLKTKSHISCIFVFVGNMYPFKGSILGKLRKSTFWTSLIVGALLADGSSIWEELRSKKDLLDEFNSDLELGKPEIFLSEVMNDENAAMVAHIDFNKMPKDPVDLANCSPQGSFIIIDPAGRKRNSDNTAIGYFEIFDGKPMLRELTTVVRTPGGTINHALEIAMRKGCYLIAVESVAYQESLLYWFDKICKEIGLAGIDFVEVYPGRVIKNSRIKAMLELLVTTEQKEAELLIADSCRAVVQSAIARWNPLKNDNQDDELDVLCYAPQVIQNYSHLTSIRGVIDSVPAIRTYTLAENSSF